MQMKDVRPGLDRQTARLQSRLTKMFAKKKIKIKKITAHSELAEAE